MIVYPSNTVNAYNHNGGRSTCTNPKGVSLSFKRPAGVHTDALEFFQWIDNGSFNVDYIGDKDLDDFSNMKDYKIIIIPGHSEYWTRKGRRNFDKFIDRGGNAVILSGNTMWKEVRYENDNVICFDDYYSDSLVHDTLKSTNYGLKQLEYPIENSVGVNFVKGGFGLDEDKGWDGYKIVSNSPLLENTNIEIGDVLSIPTREYDGAPLIFEKGKPFIDSTKQKFYRQQLLGFDKGFRIRETYGTFIVFQKSENSGIIINTASTDWCSKGFSGRDGEKIKKLTYNFIDFLLNDKSVF